MHFYRNNGAVGAILDEYEKSIHELKIVIKNLSSQQITKIVDKETTDPDCKSIQTILAHIVSSGFNYVIAIRKSLGEVLSFTKPKLLETSEKYILSLDKMFEYNEQLFKDYPNLTLNEYDSKKKVHASWGQDYDVEQLFEHAIVHILRHRRQIQRFKPKL